MDAKYPTRLRRITEAEEPKRHELIKALEPDNQDAPRPFATASTQAIPMSNDERATNDSNVIMSDENKITELNNTASVPVLKNVPNSPDPLDNLNIVLNSGSNAATILASYRRSAKKTERKRYIVPKRTTSVTRPAKRKRHEEVVAFHRHSCQLFSSLDATLAEMRFSVSSSSSASASSSSSISASSSPPSSVLRSSLDSSSVDSSRSSPLLGPTTTDSNGVRSLNLKPKIQRPSLQRMSCTVSPPAEPELTHNSTSVEVNSSYSLPSTPVLQQLSTTCSAPASSSPSKRTPRSQFPKLATHSTYSSQTTLPLATALTRNSTTTTTICWTSPESRRKEYAKIDAANSGFRLFLRKVFPRTMCRKIGGGRTGFWNENRSGSATDDVASVRRFRLSIDKDDKIGPVVESNEILNSDIEKKAGHSILEVREDVRWDEKGLGIRTTTKASSDMSNSSVGVPRNICEIGNLKIPGRGERSWWLRIVSSRT